MHIFTHLIKLIYVYYLAVVCCVWLLLLSTVVSCCLADNVSFTELLPKTLQPSGTLTLTSTLCVPADSPAALTLHVISVALTLSNIVPVPDIITSMPVPSITALYPDDTFSIFIASDDM